MNPISRLRALFGAYPLRTMAIWLALVVIVFLTRNRWEAWVVEAGPPEHLGGFSTVVNSPDGTRAVIGGNKQACLWDIESAEAIAFLPIVSFGGCQTLAFSPDGRALAYVGSNLVGGLPNMRSPNPQVLHAISGKTILDLGGLSGRANQLVFYPDGSRIVVGCADGTAPVWDATTGRRLFTLQGQQSVRSIFFSPDGAYLGTASQSTGDTVYVWCARTGSLLQKCYGGYFLGFSASSKRLLTKVTRTDQAFLWDVVNGSKLAEWSCGIGSMSMLRDGTRIVIAGRDGFPLKVYDAETGGPVVPEPPIERWERCPFRSLDGKLVAFQDERDMIHIWDSTTRRRIWEFRPAWGSRQIKFLGGARRLVTLWPEGPLQIWDVAAKTLAVEFPKAYRFRVLGDSRLLVSPVLGADYIVHRIRPEYWWGVFYLRHFWVIVALSVALALSAWKDARDLRRARAG